MVGGASIVSARVVVNETLLRVSTNLCKTTVGTDASQHHPFSMFQAMHLGLYLEWEPNFETGKLELRQNKTRISEKIVISYFQRVGPQCNVEIFTEQVRREKRMLVELKAFVDWQHSV